MSNSRIVPYPRLARAFKALAHPHRLKLLHRLMAGPRPAAACRASRICSCVGELGHDLGIAPSTVSHHLKKLHEAGLIRMARQGQRIECSVAPGVLSELAAFLAGQGTPGRRPRR
ncbi:MAG TPA: ArsR family transcriptional regulator [candidate division WOR-3 bacterium]|uniref:ArsR family transcriptional regulator n=1 Tax=candidate division WOR-3 bacterium TaxID=2052148 RepID=A0A7V0T747_UNCW3|nr:ArsR family transcriptional regulator [candidate division WOR-3 bacterium]